MTVALCTWGNALEGGTEEALTLAHKLSAARGSALHWVVVGGVAEEAQALAGKYGVASVDVVTGDGLEKLGPDALVSALAGYCAQASPTTILFNQTLEARLIAPRLAGRLGVPVVMNGFDVNDSDGALHITATGYGGDTHVVYELGAPVNVVSLITTSIVATPAEPPTTPDTRTISVDLAGVAERFQVTTAAKAEGPRLEDAEVIVSGGRGLGTKENYEMVKELAAALNGLAGASRAIVDDGWVDSSVQVGSTGKITRPGLYMAIGISGASQHMAGCSAAKTIVAVNSDPDASIYRYARYGIVADCLEVLPELIKAAKA
jgi:electron transfer flavoprotein alpha subunit